MFNFLFLVSAIVLIAIDYIYLNVMKGYFNTQVQKVQGSSLTINYLGAAICYIFLVIGINYFIIKPRRPVSDAFLLGIIIYGVFDTTNYALFKNWSILTVIIDTLWGGLLFASTAYVTNLIRKI